MMGYVAKKIFGTRNDRVLKSIRPLVERINSLESQYAKISDNELSNQTNLFKQRIEKGEALDELLPESFAVVREAGKRVLGMRHFDVQLVGGVVLHRGMIAEMKTGEGKTLVATLPAYLNALSGKGVHVVTVNDYLARRDAEWMGRLYQFLGLSVGVIVPQIEPAHRRQAYMADITYGQNNEFGFDYLRDNMKYSIEDMAQREGHGAGHNFAIVDEVDSILIDEARTPLIISGPAEDSTEMYQSINQVIPKLDKEKHVEIDVKTKQPSLTEDGIARIEEILSLNNLYDPQNTDVVHHLAQALKAHFTMELDVDYVVREGQVMIVDEFTGRLMPGRRWSDGLHQAVEAKEGLKIARENQTLASITFQNYFRMYSKLSGMTGTADTEAVEFKKIYNLEVVVIPTNKKMVRDDMTDLVYKNKSEKIKAVEEKIEELSRSKQPVLVGTISIEQSEKLSAQLKKKGVAHNVLNAKQHEREAEIVAQAGRLGSVTIATNMAGRGTDIVLGGNPEWLAAAETGTRDLQDSAYVTALEKYRAQCAVEREQVLQLGGLHILGTERHESRRIDNQLRGRSGRQGDPGSTQFYVSLEDDLMKRFGGDRVQKMMDLLKVDPSLTLEGRLISGSIESAQRRVEGFHFDIRKHLLEYDDVMNKQRQVIYSERSDILADRGIRDKVLNMADDLIENVVIEICDERQKPMEWDLTELAKRFGFYYSTEVTFPETMQLDQQSVFDLLRSRLRSGYNEQLARIGEEQMQGIEKHIFLESLDHFWKLHLLEMDHLKEGIGLRGYGQKNPLHEYQREGFILFEKMIQNMKEDVVRKLYAIRPLSESEIKAIEEAENRKREQAERMMQLNHSSPNDLGDSNKERAKDPNVEAERLKALKRARRRGR